MSMTAAEQQTVNEVARKLDSLVMTVSALDSKVDGLQSSVDRAMGLVAALRWLGPTGVAIVVIALMAYFTGHAS